MPAKKAAVRNDKKAVSQEMSYHPVFNSEYLPENSIALAETIVMYLLSLVVVFSFFKVMFNFFGMDTNGLSYYVVNLVSSGLYYLVGLNWYANSVLSALINIVVLSWLSLILKAKFEEWKEKAHPYRKTQKQI